MAFLIGGANSAADTGYSVANSCMFNDGDSAYMQKTSSGGNRKTFTFSAWVKRSALGGGVSGYNTFFSSDEEVENSFRLTFSSDASNDKIMTYFYTGSMQMQLVTTQVFRDVSAWYHVVVAVDTTQGTEANRTKLYVNGVQITSFSTENYPDENQDMSVNQSGAPARVGAGTSLFFDGYMAEVVLIDGTAYAASDFGEFDEDSPTIWKPKDVSGLTFGTNGFYLDFEASGNLGNDANGGTDLTETNVAATDQSTDTPTNNFCTYSNEYNRTDLTLSEGNLKCVGDSTWAQTFGTIGVSTGKWYWEILLDNTGSSTYIKGGFITDIGSVLNTSNNDYLFHVDHALGWAAYSLAGAIEIRNDSAVISGYANSDLGDTTFADGDTLCLALDMTNTRFHFRKNDGDWLKSGDPAGNSGGLDFTLSDTIGRVCIPACSISVGTCTTNFGSPSFSISSSNADGDGYGSFEYEPPSGFYALCTKNLAKYG